jgi:abhydrolase domain-containing protein 2
VEKNNMLYLELAHGGHLGFYEGGLIYPNPVTGLARRLLALVGSIAINYNDSIMKTAHAV